MNEFPVESSYDISCIEKGTNENNPNFNHSWNASIIMNKDNLFLGIAKNEMDIEFLIVGIYLPDKGIYVRSFINESFVIDYSSIINEPNYNGTIYGLFDKSKYKFGECKFEISENKEIDSATLLDKLEPFIKASISNKLQAHFLCETLNTYEIFTKKIEKCYKKHTSFSS